jgi:hypothetical protein
MQQYHMIQALIPSDLVPLLLGNFYQTIYQLVRMDKNIPFG